MHLSFRMIAFISKSIRYGPYHSLSFIAYETLSTGPYGMYHMAHMIWVKLADYLALYEIHNLSNCPDNPTKLINKFCDIWYFIMTFAFLLILVVLAFSCYYCTHRIYLKNLNSEWGVLITMWYHMVHIVWNWSNSKYWKSIKRKSSYNDGGIESIWSRKKAP